MDPKLANLIKKPITLEPYYYKVYLVIGEDEFSYLKEQNPDWHVVEAHEPHVKRELELPSTCVGACLRAIGDKEGELAILYIRSLKDKMLERTIIHESLHVVLGMFDSRGVDIGITNEEALCYHLEFLYQEVQNLLKKRDS